MLTTPDLTVLRDLAIAILMGGLVGLEREAREKATGFSGLRTMALLGLLGGIGGWMWRALETPWPLAALALGAAALLIAGYMRAESRGMTSEVAGLVVVGLGAMAGAGHPQMAVPLGIVATGILAFKGPLHAFAARVGRDDMEAGLQLLAATFIVLPMLPDHPVDPWDALNPYKLWLLVILISGLGLLGYVATRLLGPRGGRVVGGLAGGLVSSTAATLGFARESRKDDAHDGLVAMAVLLAWAVMFVRVLIEVAVVKAPLLARVGPPVGAMALVAGLLAGVYWYRASGAATDGERPEYRNPFSLWAAIQFAAMFALVLLAVAVLESRLAEEWMYGLAALAGATDVDAITLSLAGSESDLSEVVVVRGITLAAVSNTVVKCGMAVALGSNGLRWRIGLATGAIAVVGGVVAGLM